MVLIPEKQVAQIRSTRELVTQTTHGFSVGDVLRPDGAGDFTEAQADSAVNAEAVGVVSGVPDANTFEITYSGLVTGLSGLTAGETHFLSSGVAGLLTATEPTGISKPILIAVTATTAIVSILRGIDGGGASGGGAWAVVAEEILTVDSSTIDFANLPAGYTGGYMLAYRFEGDSNNAGVHVFFNEDYTNTNYYIQREISGGSAGTVNQPLVGNVHATPHGGVITVKIYLEPVTGTIHFDAAHSSANNSSSVPHVRRTQGYYTTTGQTNIDDIRAQVVGDANIGSIFTLYKMS
jgi:hypothetical protein